MNNQPIPNMVQNIPFPYLFPWNLEIPQYLLQQCQSTNSSTNSIISENEASTRCSSATEPTSSSRCSSVESSLGKTRRGRPQQHIEDASDLQSQQKKHRRLYARNYRLKIRQAVDQSKLISDEKMILQQQVQKLQAEAEILKKQLNQANALIHQLMTFPNFGNAKHIMI